MQVFLEMTWEICQHFPFYYLKMELRSAPLWEFKVKYTENVIFLGPNKGPIDSWLRKPNQLQMIFRHQ